jgi:AAA15 family ATPase/GTPase
LCRIRFSSPFSVHHQEDLFSSHQESVETKHFSKIISFIRENIDNDIENIELVSNNGLQRFLVSHKKFTNAVDLTQFGDGLQRIFHISLLFAAARNGILMIDELENAIHHRLLQKFIHFIKQATEEFGIQLFITSHSKECIDMFFENEETSANISAYRLEQNEGKIVCKYSEGKRFSRLIHSFNTDLRS